MRFATVERESGFAGNAGDEEKLDVGVAAVIVVVEEGTAAEDVPPAPARSHGFGGEPADMTCQWPANYDLHLSTSASCANCADLDLAVLVWVYFTIFLLAGDPFVRDGSGGWR